MKKVVNQKVILISLMFVMLFAYSIILIGCGSVNTGKINFIVDAQTYESVETDGFERITLPDEPVKDGYDFAGWYYDDQTFEFVFEETDFIKQQLTVELSLYAKFEPSILRTINYNLDGGVNSPNNVDSLPSGQEFVLSEPTSPNEYLKFDGWFTDSKFETQITTIPKGRESQYAKWVVKDEYGLYVVKSGSMEPALAVGQSVITTSDYQELRVDDIIVFSYDESSSYTCHRIVEINEVEGQTRYITKGDSNSYVDAWYVTAENILGKVIAVIETPASDSEDSNVNMGGQISFTASDVNATVAINVEGTTGSTDTDDDKTFTFNAEQGSDTETWNGKDWTFDDARTITVTVTVHNADTARSLTSTFTAPAALTSNLACATTEDSEPITAGVATSGTTVAPGEDVVYVMTFTIDDENLSVSSAAWTATLALANA